jgi:hypothetical protein
MSVHDAVASTFNPKHVTFAHATPLWKLQRIQIQYMPVYRVDYFLRQRRYNYLVYAKEHKVLIGKFPARFGCLAWLFG